jgi:uncharacterized protein (DUF58 family)
MASLWQDLSGEHSMILFLAFLLIALWLLGMVTTTTLGGWLHVLLIVAIVFLLIRVIRGHGLTPAPVTFRRRRTERPHRAAP